MDLPRNRTLRLQSRRLRTRPAVAHLDRPMRPTFGLEGDRDAHATTADEELPHDDRLYKPVRPFYYQWSGSPPSRSKARYHGRPLVTGIVKLQSIKTIGREGTYAVIDVGAAADRNSIIDDA